MQKWYDWLGEVLKKDEIKKWEEVYRRKVSQTIKSADGSAGLVHRITKSTAWTGRVQIFKDGGRRCQADESLRRKVERMGKPLAM